MDMKLEVKVAYSILKDRLELSLSRGWIDEEGAVYLVFSNSKLMKLLGCSKSKLLSIKKTLKEYDLIDEVQQSSSEKGRLANKIYLGELSSTPVGISNRPSVKKRLGQVENETTPVLHSATSETEVSETKYSETDSLFIEDEEDRNTQPILKRKVEKVTKYDRDYIWGLVQDQFRREGFSETASEIAMTDFERIYQYALDNVRFVRRAEVLAEFVVQNRENPDELQHHFDFIYGVQTDDNPTQALARFRQNEITKEEMLAEFRKPYSFKQLSIHNQSFCDIMKIEKVYQSKTGEELQKWQQYHWKIILNYIVQNYFKHY